MRITAGREDTGSTAAAALAALAAFALALLLAAPDASAAPPQLWQTCETGSGAGQCDTPRGIAANPDNGHVFVAEQNNQRVTELDALGNFVKAWGWDVVASGPGDSGTGFEVCVSEDGDVCKAGIEGSGAGQFDSPQGLALDSAGNVYVTDFSNQRVQKFSGGGQFLLMLGDDVVAHGSGDSSTDEQQEVTIAASGGSFKLAFTTPFPPGGTQQTPSLPYDASAAEVDSALEALSTIGGIGGSVSVSGGPGDGSGSSPYQIAFEGNLGGDDVPPLALDRSDLDLPEAGARLRCSVSISLGVESLSYQWLRNGIPIGGATEATYTTTASDAGTAIQCLVLAKNGDTGLAKESGTPQIIVPSPATALPVPAFIDAPATSGPLTVGGGGGQTLTCNPNAAGWAGSPTFTYSWYRNGEAIGGATASTYVVTAGDLSTAAVFQCGVTGTNAGGGVTRIGSFRFTSPGPDSIVPQLNVSLASPNTVSTANEGGAAEICAAASGAACKVGSIGTADGQFGNWKVGDLIAIDDQGTESTADDAVHVGDDDRIQTFAPSGAYQSQFAVPQAVEGLDVDAAGNLYAIHGNAVHKLSPAGVPLSPETFKVPVLAEFENPFPNAVAVDAAGHVFLFGPTSGGSGSGSPRDPLIEFDAAGNLVDEFGKGEFLVSTGLATNLCEGSAGPGNLYVTNAFGNSSSNIKTFLRAYGTDPVGCFKATTLPASDLTETSATLNGTVNPSGSLTSECRFRYGTTASYGSTVPCEESPAQIGSGEAPVPVHADLSSLTKGTVYHFRLVAEVKGVSETGADRTFKTLGPPTISEDRTVGSAYTEATVRGQVNPEGFATTYRVQYVQESAFEAEGFVSPLQSPATPIGSERGDRPVTVNLEGLEPGASYRWRFVAVNSSGETLGGTHGFATYRQPGAQASCPNQAFRGGPSSFLPDCRAYEMVSPVDKNGGDIVNAISGVGNVGGYVQSAPDGDRLTYTALVASFAGQPNSAKFNQYLATRSEAGWSNAGIRPPVTGSLCCEILSLSFGVVREFMAFSEDLCNAWLLDVQAPALTADAQQGLPNLYRRQNCGADAGELEALTATPPALTPGTDEGYVSVHALQGFSNDLRHAFFVAREKLNSDAAEVEKAQVYDRFEGSTRLVSVLPSGGPDESGAVVGGGAPETLIGGGNLDNAVSEDGSLVYWTSKVDNLQNGKIYLRRHPEQGIVGDECSKASKACTLPVSSGNGAFFWTAAADGSKALYSEGSTDSGLAKLYEFDLAKAEAEEPARRLIAENVTGAAGASEDLSRIYFVSGDVLPGAGQNSEGEEAIGGQPNLYLDEEGTPSFVGTLAGKDVGELEPGDSDAPYRVAARNSYGRATRVTPDGARIVFNSRAPLTGYDNAGEDGRPAVEVFTYETGGELTCVSCNPSGARPSPTPAMRIPYAQPFELEVTTNVPAAAWIPSWEHKLHASNVLSQDGDRIFFNANDALLPRDTNGAQDVYEWEAPGAGSCDEEDASYFAENGGCLYLISSGESPEESEFWEASPDGEDVFFNTAASLLPQDPGSVDLYDARVGGGFAQPAEKAACEGEACQVAPPPPTDPTPGSASFRGPGDQIQKPPARCRKGKVRRRGRCVAKKPRKRAGKAAKKRRANHERRAGR
jgi:hypothetical protein